MLKSWLTKRHARTAAGIERFRPQTRGQRGIRAAAVFVLVTLAFSYLDRIDFFRPVEYWATKARSGIYGAQAEDKESATTWARKQIVLVPISDQPFRPGGTFAALGAPPLPRSYHAKLIRELTRCGAKVIAFDLVFDLASKNDAELAAAAIAHGRVLWGAAYEDETDPKSQGFEPVKALLASEPLPRAHLGHLLVPQNELLTEIDRIRPFIDRTQGTVGAISVQSALLSLGLEKERPKRDGDAWTIGRYRMPVDAHGYFTFSYFGKPANLNSPDKEAQGAFTVVPYEMFFSGPPMAEDPFYKNYFRDKIVLIGDTTKVGNDHRLTAVGDMWGMEIHAHAMATILRGLRGQASFVREAPAWLNLLSIAVMTALICALAGFARINIAALASCVLVALYFFGNAWLYAAIQMKISLVAPSLAMIFAAATLLLERGLTEEKEKNRARGLLGRYVSPQIATYILNNPDKVVLGGERVHATVLFSDIRGFTSMSEKLPPEQVVARLNEYLQAMTDQVFLFDGAVDKYIGDAIMALFGVPLPHPDHAHRAVASAIAMQERLFELQAKWLKEGLPAIDIGIGIHTGDMVVGNIGARDRLDFTIIGDSVNLASRVESLNKEMKTRILITRATLESVADELEVRGPFSVTVKGKEEGVEVFEVIGWKKDAKSAVTSTTA